jgi:hypothetical protein
MEQENFIINKCIYCDGIGETDEHIIPFALGGIRKLLNASCEHCRSITSECESNLLKKNWAEARAVLDYPSRHRDFGTEKFSLEVIFENGSEGVLKLSKTETLGIAMFPEYPLPAFFAPDNYKGGVNLIGISTISFGPDFRDLFKKYRIKTISPKSTHKIPDFERMVAKIGYCAAIAAYGLDIGFWMGCDREGSIVPLLGKQSEKNIIVLHILKNTSNDTRHVLARIKFFASSDAPEYIVIVGTLKPDFTIP